LKRSRKHWPQSWHDFLTLLMGWSEGSHPEKNLSAHTAPPFEIPLAVAGYTLMDKTETKIKRML